MLRLHSTQMKMFVLFGHALFFFSLSSRQQQQKHTDFCDMWAWLGWLSRSTFMVSNIDRFQYISVIPYWICGVQYGIILIVSVDIQILTTLILKTIGRDFRPCQKCLSLRCKVLIPKPIGSLLMWALLLVTYERKRYLDYCIVAF